MKSQIVSLSKNEDFKKILGGSRISNKYVTIFFKKLSDKNNKFLNISFVTKKRIGNAIIRNKIKRRLRNIMYEALKTIKIKREYTYLFIAKKNVFHDDYLTIKENIFKDLSRIKK